MSAEKLKIILKKIPWEVYLIYLPMVLIMILSLFSFRDFFFGFLLSFKTKNALIFAKEGAGLMGILWLLLITGFIIKYFYNKRISTKNDLRSYLIDIWQFIYLFLIPGLFYGEFLYYIFLKANIADTIFYSQLYTKWDHNIFGVDLLYFALRPLSHIPFFEWTVLSCYDSLLTVITFFTIILFFVKRELFRKFISTYFFVIFLGMLIWIRFPSIGPAPMYINNLLSADIPLKTELLVYNDKPSQFLIKNLQKQEEIYVDPTLKTIPVSTNPSMHVAWSIIMLYYVFLLSNKRYIRYIFIAFTIFNVLGAVYIGQHYGVDVIGGIIVSLIGIFIIKKINNLALVSRVS